MLGSTFFATGLLGEQIAQQRSEVRELRRELDDLATAQQIAEADAAWHDAAGEAGPGVARDAR
jgi:hypothetical protein